MPTEDEVLNCLQIGRQNARTARRIAQELNISDHGVEVPLRDILRNAIQNGRLVGSCNRGFYIIDNEVDLQRILNSLDSRIQRITERRTNLHRNWAQRNMIVNENN